MVGAEILGGFCSERLVSRNKSDFCSFGRIRFRAIESNARGASGEENDFVFEEHDGVGLGAGGVGMGAGGGIEAMVSYHNGISASPETGLCSPTGACTVVALCLTWHMPSARPWWAPPVVSFHSARFFP